MSKKWNLNFEDVQKISKNATIFFSPVAIIYLTFLLTALKDGFQTSDLVPNSEAVTAIVLWIVNTLIDIFRKLQSGK
jgi:hypothetical protein